MGIFFDAFIQKFSIFIPMRILLLFLLFSGFISAQEISLKKGIVHDQIPLNDSVSETYSVFLPSEFDGVKPLPVIYIFDPEGRGKSAAQLFKPTAEIQNYILVSSNNIDYEKSLKENVMAATRLIGAVMRRFPIDFNQVYVAGLGEGGKVASSLPVILPGLAGVIAVGEQHLNFEMLNKRDPFTFVGVVGDEEISFFGMTSAVETLKAEGFPAVVYIFDGGNQWPDPGVISKAVSSLSLQAMKNGVRPVEIKLARESLEDDLSTINQLISNEKYLLANHLLDIVQEKYEGIIEVSEFSNKQRHLQNSRNFQEQQEKLSEFREEEIVLLNDYLYFFDNDVATANFENLSWWNYQKLLLKEYTESENEIKRNIGYRLLDLLEKVAAEKIKVLEKEDAPLNQRLFAYMFQTIFDQKDFEAYKKIISLSAIDGDFSTALFYLEEMLKNGYKDKEALYNIEGTLGLKLSQDFNWLIDKYLGSAKYYEVND